MYCIPSQTKSRFRADFFNNIRPFETFVKDRRAGIAGPTPTSTSRMLAAVHHSFC